jgi:diguanylate cyclase (GGDEF)-like protein
LNNHLHTEQKVLDWLLRHRGFQGVAAITLVSVALSVIVSCLLVKALGFGPLVMMRTIIIATAVPIVVAPLSLMPLVHVVGKLHEARTQLTNLASTDTLTDVATRRAFFERASSEWAQGSRYQYPISVVMLDIDHFKSINDDFGHAFGDTVLQKVAMAIRDDLRQPDLLGRYGGEEFVILLPMTDVESARVVTERTLEAVRHLRIDSPDGHRVKMTASAGIASCLPVTAPLHDMIALADRALYAAKAAGRDRVVIDSLDLVVETPQRESALRRSKPEAA